MAFPLLSDFPQYFYMQNTNAPCLNLFEEPLQAQQFPTTQSFSRSMMPLSMPPPNPGLSIHPDYLRHRPYPYEYMPIYQNRSGVPINRSDFRLAQHGPSMPFNHSQSRIPVANSWSEPIESMNLPPPFGYRPLFFRNPSMQRVAEERSVHNIPAWHVDRQTGPGPSAFPSKTIMQPSRNYNGQKMLLFHQNQFPSGPILSTNGGPLLVPGIPGHYKMPVIIPTLRRQDVTRPVQSPMKPVIPQGVIPSRSKMSTQWVPLGDRSHLVRRDLNAVKAIPTPNQETLRILKTMYATWEEAAAHARNCDPNFKVKELFCSPDITVAVKNEIAVLIVFFIDDPTSLLKSISIPSVCSPDGAVAPSVASPRPVPNSGPICASEASSRMAEKYGIALPCTPEFNSMPLNFPPPNPGPICASAASSRVAEKFGLALPCTPKFDSIPLEFQSSRPSVPFMSLSNVKQASESSNVPHRSEQFNTGQGRPSTGVMKKRKGTHELDFERASKRLKHAKKLKELRQGRNSRARLQPIKDRQDAYEIIRDTMPEMPSFGTGIYCRSPRAVVLFSCSFVSFVRRAKLQVYIGHERRI
ncbi:hypothetical protein M422DRAFT_777976 [Sphaerobolus stellatus SS14]|uniref:Uncharacterized protein n=1 Tax=Sphaerobolus stellatus (strain SS14) TaxID=990650 RepID=A0A0C9W5S9_SPHS4|nr:hypothetical protein M422DRAFT_777976 [Sphaerobolus stellatus SS14]